ncbi:permease [Alteromonas lipolytica]|uniref:Probable membrane transporter protein n=1 Tax=Alteromonas lipolytica TaxID=1856405 RepID=A0A1E8FHA7_9ALTE|nr:permease [Alteromonas lipolytica]
MRVKNTFSTHPWLTLLAIAWLLLVLLAGNTQLFTLLSDFGAFLFLGVIGAIFANATGAGGGVVFVPFFQQLAFTPETVVATSFAIQCCGMSAGALSWGQFYRHTQRQQANWQPLPGTLKYSIPMGLCGLWLAQFGFDYFLATLSFSALASQLHIGFGVFSMGLAVAILLSLKRLNQRHCQTVLGQIDKFALPMLAFIGGILTAYLSVGIGEIIAVYLIVRRFDVTLAIGAAVIISACTVWGGVLHGLLVTQAVNWQVVLFAGAGAVIGGRIARYLVLFFSPRQVKLFFALWVFVLGLISLL